VATEHHAAYLVELSKAWALEPHRPVWLQEVGAPQPHIPADRAAAFTRATVEAALDCPDVWGVTWWCSHDVPRRLADFPELEYSLGLFTEDQRPKPAARALAEVARDRRAAPRPAAPRTTALVLDAHPEGPESHAEGTRPGRSVCAPGGSFFEAFARLTARGARPAVVLAERADDAQHLTARGITDLVTVEQT
ncbi:glycosyl hydrolase, partial [Streptomyces albus subsp. chlorinus]|nr:glycosyl hydrolase [Streptomyces albus subsp. chlorinus]